MDPSSAAPPINQERQGLSRSTRTGSGTRFSGAPLWRFTLRKEEQRRLLEDDSPQETAPEGFIRRADGWYWHPQQQVFWQSGTQRYYLYSEDTRTYVEIPRAASAEGELRVVVDASCIHRPDSPREDRHVIIRDLAKAAQALRMPVDHLARPVALFAVFDGHRPLAPARPEAEEAPACAEFCARNLHLKLLPRLSAFRGPWDDRRLAGALRASCEELDADFLARGSAADGCSAVIALLSGRQLVVAGIGDAVGLVAEQAKDGDIQVAQRTLVHSPALPSELRRISDGGGVVVQDGPRGRHAVRLGHADQGDKELLFVSRAFGDRAFKAGRGPGAREEAARSQPPLVIATPDISTVELQETHLFLGLACSEVAAELAEQDLVRILGRHRGRPRAACGALMQAARARGAEGSLTALCASLEWSRAAAETMASEPLFKKPRVESPKQVRCRQILVRFKDCKEPFDRVRSRPVARSLADAERILVEALDAIQSSPEKSIFTQRCKAVSECSTCLKGGEMAGDLGWMSRGQAHPAVEAAAFSLPVGHISDVVESDEGVHVLWRIA